MGKIISCWVRSGCGLGKGLWGLTGMGGGLWLLGAAMPVVLGRAGWEGTPFSPAVVSCATSQPCCSQPPEVAVLGCAVTGSPLPSWSVGVQRGGQDGGCPRWGEKHGQGEILGEELRG